MRRTTARTQASSPRTAQAALYGLLASTLALCLGGAAAHAEGDAAAGKDKASLCIACHGEDGNSPDAQWPHLAGQHARYIERQLVAFKLGETRNNGVMLGMAAGLDEQDMADLGAYYASLSPRPGIAEGDAALIARGERIFRDGDAENGIPACMSCHGPAGAGDPLGGFPKLSGQYAQYTAMQLKAFRAGERSNDANAMMRGTALRLTDTDIDALSLYISGLYR